MRDRKGRGPDVEDHQFREVRPSHLNGAAAASGFLWSIGQRVGCPDLVFAAFETQAAAIRDGLDRPDDGTTFDVHPIDRTPLLTSGLPWAPRPIVQGCSAFSPLLSALNPAEIAGPDALDDLPFDVKPPDGRYPSPDDVAN